MVAVSAMFWLYSVFCFLWADVTSPCLLDDSTKYFIYFPKESSWNMWDSLNINYSGNAHPLQQCGLSMCLLATLKLCTSEKYNLWGESYQECLLVGYIKATLTYFWSLGDSATLAYSCLRTLLWQLCRHTVAHLNIQQTQSSISIHSSYMTVVCPIFYFWSPVSC